MGGILRCTLCRPRQTTAECHCHNNRCRHQCHWHCAMPASVEANLMTMIMTSTALWLGVSGLRESMTPVGGYESSWRHINLRPFQPFSTRNITRLGRTHAAPNVRTKSTLHVFTFREDLRYFSDAGSVSGQLIDSDHRAVKASLRSLVPPKNKKKLKNDRKRFMRLDYAILQ